MADWINTLILGIVEGVTEFLPISSTGHLIIAENILHCERSEFFNVGIQAGAVSAVVLIYWRKLWLLASGWKEKENQVYIAKLFAAFVVTCALGLVAKKAGFKLPEDPTPIAWATLIGGLFIFAAEWHLRRVTPSDSLNWKTALITGGAQVLAAIFPGTSRSAATIIPSMLCGASRPAATEFSFLLGIPTMFAASSLTFIAEWKKNGGLPKDEWIQFLLGFAVSAVVAFAVVKWLLGYIRSHSFNPFAWYRLALGLGLLAWLWHSKS